MKSYNTRLRAKEKKQRKRIEQKVKGMRQRAVRQALDSMNIKGYRTPVQTVAEICTWLGYECHVDSQSDVDEVLQFFTDVQIHPGSYD